MIQENLLDNARPVITEETANTATGSDQEERKDMMRKTKVSAFTAAVCLVVALAAHCRAEDVTVDSITYRADDGGDIRKYLSSREIFMAARKKLLEAEGSGDRAVQPADFVSLRSNLAAAYTNVMLIRAGLDIVPTIPETQPASLTKAQDRQQWDEAKAVGELLPFIQMRFNDRKALEGRLSGMLVRFRNHAAEGVILLALVDLCKDSPEQEIAHLKETVKCRVSSDEWGFAQQHAWQKLSAAYEKQGKYAAAVDALESWRICEPCGTGADASRIRKTFRILGLKLHFTPEDQVFAELWRNLESGSITFGCGETLGELTQRIRALYGDGHVRALKEKVSELQKKYPGTGDESRQSQSMVKILAEVSSQLGFVDELAKASLARTLEILASVRADPQAEHIHGSLDELNVPRRGGPLRIWRERLLVAKLLEFDADEVVPSLIAVDTARHDCCALLALGRIGGRRGFEYLSGRVKTETNLWSLRDYYYGLVLCGDDQSLKFVRSAAAESSGNNRAAAAWAMEQTAVPAMVQP